MELTFLAPVGLAALMTSKLYSPSLIVAIDTDENRLKVAKKLGADHLVNPDKADVKEAIMGLTDNTGADTVIEACGIPMTLELAQDLVAPGGVIANIGVHGKECTLKIDKLWGHNIALTTRLVDTVTTPTLIKLFAAGSVPAGELITHGKTLFSEVCHKADPRPRLSFPRDGEGIHDFQGCFGKCRFEDVDFDGEVTSVLDVSIRMSGQERLIENSHMLYRIIRVMAVVGTNYSSSSLFPVTYALWFCFGLCRLTIDKHNGLVAGNSRVLL